MFLGPKLSQNTVLQPKLGKKARKPSETMYKQVLSINQKKFMHFHVTVFKRCLAMTLKPAFWAQKYPKIPFCI